MEVVFLRNCWVAGVFYEIGATSSFPEQVTQQLIALGRVEAAPAPATAPEPQSEPQPASVTGPVRKPAPKAKAAPAPIKPAPTAP